jgi:hypothetical protein
MSQAISPFARQIPKHNLPEIALELLQRFLLALPRRLANFPHIVDMQIGEGSESHLFADARRFMMRNFVHSWLSVHVLTH